MQYRAPANIANGTYYIRNKNSGLYLDVPNWGGSQTNLKQYDFNGGTNQRWVIQRQSNGLYVLKPSHNTNLAIDVYNALDQDNVNIWAFTANNSAAQEWYIIPNGDGSCRILSRCSNGWRALVVQSASSSVGANIIQHTYTAGGNTNDDWYLESADRIAELTVYSLPQGGHAWITIKNRLGTDIQVGTFSVSPGQEISLGTFGNQFEHLGIWYNIESLNADHPNYIGRVSLSQFINFNQLATINTYIQNNDSWSVYNNCSNFAAGVWNAVSDDDVKFSVWPMPSVLADEIKKRRIIKPTGYSKKLQRMKTSAIRLIPVPFIPETFRLSAGV